MTNLSKLKRDLDVCYKFAVQAFGKKYVDQFLEEPPEDENEQENDGQLAQTEFLRDTIESTEYRCDNATTERSTLPRRSEAKRDITRAKHAPKREEITYDEWYDAG